MSRIKVIHAESATQDRGAHAARLCGYAESATEPGIVCAELATDRLVIHAESATHSYKSLIVPTYRGGMWPILRKHMVMRHWPVIQPCCQIDSA